MYLQSYINRCCRVSPIVLSKHQNSGGVSCQSTNTLWDLQVCTVRVPTLTEGVTSTVVVLSEYLPWVSPNMLVKAPNSGGVSFQSTNTLRESPGMYCQSTNTGWGSHVILAARCFSNVLVKAPVVDWLRELHLFSVKPVSSFLCLLHTSISFKTVQVLRACKQGTNRFEMRS